MPPKIEVRELTKNYDGVPALRGISFEVHAGEVFGLLGSNGAGKTTAIECVAALREPDAGELRVCGEDVRKQAARAKHRLGVVLQDTGLPDAITPREALQLFGSFHAEPVAPDLLLARFGLTGKADARYGTLSAGQRQRVALALSCVNRPEVILLDEPAAGLDPAARHELCEEILQMKNDGCAVLFATHHLEEAERLCDRVAVVDRGRIVADGTPRALIDASNAAQLVTVTTSRPLNASAFQGSPDVREFSAAPGGNTAQFRTARPAHAIAALTARLAGDDIELLELHVAKATLEDVFLGLVHGDAARARPENHG